MIDFRGRIYAAATVKRLRKTGENGELTTHWHLNLVIQHLVVEERS